MNQTPVAGANRGPGPGRPHAGIRTGARPHLRSLRKRTLREVIDLSISQTLARSLYTSLTAFLAVLPLGLWGGTAVASFAVPMAFGIAIAAASSVFIAAPILLFLGDWRGRRGITMFAPEASEASVQAVA